jgi:hypothetical protein
MVKLQLEAPIGIAITLAPGVVGVPLPVKVIFCNPVPVTEPVPSNQIPFFKGVEMLYEPAVVTFTSTSTVFGAANAVPTVYVPFTFMFEQLPAELVKVIFAAGEPAPGKITSFFTHWEAAIATVPETESVVPQNAFHV